VGSGTFNQVYGEHGQRVALCRSGVLVHARPYGLRGIILGARFELRDTVSDIVQNVEPADALLLQQVHGMGAAFLEQGRQDVAAVDCRLP
jgi:hypothetical protein